MADGEKKSPEAGHMKHSFSSVHLPPGKGVLVSFRNIKYFVVNKKKESICLIDNVSGYLRGGEMVALLGPSGSGKTTLLDVLAGRKTVGTISGEILFGGMKPTSMFLRRYTGYVEQFDTLVPILTVSEMLQYTAELKLETSVPQHAKTEAVEEVIQHLGLDTCRNVLIGSPLARGISGGQAKRVNIAIALISNPRVLFLDEPTTGLDSFTSNEVISFVKSLAQRGITVCATVHSPTPFAFSQFDRLLVLLQGKVVYFGKNSDDTVSNYLKDASASFNHLIDDHYNSTPEWITDVVMTAERTGHLNHMSKFYEQSSACEHANSELDTQLKETVNLSKEFTKELGVRKATTTPTWYGLWILIRYRLVKNYQTSTFYASHVAPWMIQTLIMFSTFWFVADNLTQQSVTNVSGILFFWSVTPAFGAAAYVPSIMLARPLYFRERNDGLYRSITFLLYLITEETLIAVPVTMAINTIMWFGLKLSGSWILWWTSFLVTYIAGITVSYAICSVSPSIDVANAAVPIFGVICLFFSGYLIRLEDIGWWWRWFVYITPTFYSFGAQMNNFFQGDRNFPYLGSDSVTKYFGFDFFTGWEFLGMQLIFPVVYFFLAWLGLTYYKPVKR